MLAAIPMSAPSSPPRPDAPLISVVAPVLNEEACIAPLVERVRRAVAACGARHEILLVDDGSSDATPERIAAERATDPAVKTLRFTRCFGHQAALSAGLRHARGDAVVTLDGDLQHPPELIPELVARWREGAAVVETQRRSGAPPRGLADRLARAFYPLFNALSPTSLRATPGDFRLLDRQVVDAFNRLEEHFVFIRGLVPWLGFATTCVEYDLEERLAGERKYSAPRSARLALDGIFSFSVIPLRLITLLGLATTLFGVLYGVFSLASYFLGRVEDGGWTSLMVLILLFGGVQLLSLGIVSEYVGRIYEEAKRRPRYVIASTSGLDE